MDQSPIAAAVEAELADPAHADRRHGTRPCYRNGCRGPLCRRFIRRQRRRYREGKTTGYYAELDAMLEPLQAAHDNEFLTRKKTA